MTSGQRQHARSGDLMVRAGQVLADRYRLDERLAVGGAGEVWRGTDALLGRPVAVKLPRAGRPGDAALLAKFRAEARHSGSLSAPGVVRVYDYVEDAHAGCPILVMELVDGQSLADLLRAGPLDPVRAMDVVAQAAAGLHAAHLAGLVHCDVKPGNLLIGRDGTVKITDFGIAQSPGTRPGGSERHLAGTPAYLAPERVAGEAASPLSDLYSLGIVAYECLAGAQPFSGTTGQVLSAHQHRQLPPLPAAVPPQAAMLVAALTARDPAGRPGSAEEAARRAVGIRAQLSGAPPGQGAGWLESPDPTLTEIELPAEWASGLPAGHDRWRPLGRGMPRGRLARPGHARRRPPGRVRGGRLLAPGAGRSRLPLAAGLLAAGLLCLVLAGVAGALLAGPGASGPRSNSTPGVTGPPATTEVSASSLLGRPVWTVRRELRQLGLIVRVVWQPGDHQLAGTVIAVNPAGRLAKGSVVVLTAALGGNPGHDHGRGHGNGDGGGGNGGGSPGGGPGGGNGD
jgi:eukaryotic-like serine/threonine-protein kinase